MTAASTDRRADAPPSPVEEAPPPGRGRPRRTIDRLIGFGFLLALVASGFGIYLLARTGWRSILDSTDGQLTEQVTNPASPGYQAIVEPTPSLLLIQLDESGALAGVLVVGLAGDDTGGTVLLIPRNTEIRTGSGTPLASVWSSGGLVGTRDAVADLLDVNFDSVEVLDTDRWRALTEPIAPVDVIIPDSLVEPSADAGPTVRFAAGAAGLAAAEVGVYLGWSNPGESAVNMLVRQELFWEAWLDQIVGSGDPGAVPGEIETGIGRFVRGLASGPQEFEALPVEQTVAADGSELLRPIAEDLAPLVVEMLPFPLPATPGDRPRVRVLNGVGGQELTLAVTGDVVTAGGQVTIIGNADTFGLEASAVRYATDAEQESAQALADTLGIGRVEIDPSPNPAIELTVLIGSDEYGGGDGG